MGDGGRGSVGASPSEFQFLFWWCVATAAGSGLAVPLLDFLPRDQRSQVGVEVCAAFFAGGQWLVLRRYLPGAGLWIKVTMVSMVLAWPAGMLSLLAPLPRPALIPRHPLLSADLAAPADWRQLGTLLVDYVAELQLWGFAGSVAGAVLGLGQARALSEHVRAAGWWIPTSVLGSFLFSPVSGNVGTKLTTIDSRYLPIEFWMSYAALGGVLYGLSTGPVIAWLLRHRSMRGRSSGLTAARLGTLPASATASQPAGQAGPRPWRKAVAPPWPGWRR